jgi:hypothetical protein
MEKWDKSCQVTNGGYVKSWTQYRVHFATAVTGSCQTVVLQCSGLPPVCNCVNSFYYLRTLGTTYLSDPLVSSPFGAVSPQGQVQSLDTRIPSGTTSTGVSWLATQLGQHTITSNTGWNTTTCNLSPATFPADQPLVVNVVSCEPKWYKAFNPPVTVHLPATTISVYIPPGLWGTLVGPNNDRAAVLAVNDWNTALAGTGLTLQIVDQPCGSGPNCIFVGTTPTANLGTACASFTPSSISPTSGEIGGYSDIKLGEDYWAVATQVRLRRTMAHELAHGLDR